MKEALARKAPKLGANVILPAWLYRTTNFAAADALKAERRRLDRELEATMMGEVNSVDDPFWERVAPHLDEALEHLSEKDRAVIVLRFFSKKSFREVGEALGTTDDSAQKRVARALEKLRGRLMKRGVSLSAAMLAGTIMTQSIQAAPLGIAAAVTSAAVKGTVAGASILAIMRISSSVCRHAECACSGKLSRFEIAKRRHLRPSHELLRTFPLMGSMFPMRERCLSNRRQCGRR